MTALTPEAVAQMVARLRTRGHHLRATWDDGDMEFTAADMLTTLSAENATLRAERDDAFARGMAHGQKAMPKGTFNVVDSPELATLRASEAAARERVRVLTEAAAKCLALLDGLVAESGRGIDYGEEDPFRMGEWFEAEDIAAMENLRALTPPKTEGETP